MIKLILVLSQFAVAEGPMSVPDEVEDGTPNMSLQSIQSFPGAFGSSRGAEPRLGRQFRTREEQRLSDVVPSCNANSSGIEQLSINSSQNLSGRDCSNPMAYNWDRLTCMVCNLYFEARGESYEGKVAVARSVMTRVFASSYKKPTVCGVVHANWQYSWTKLVRNQTLPSHAELEKLGLIRASVEGLQKGPNCLTNYYAHNQVYPRWARGGTCSQTKVRIGNHTFCHINGKPTRSVSEVAAAENLFFGDMGGGRAIASVGGVN